MRNYKKIEPFHQPVVHIAGKLRNRSPTRFDVFLIQQVIYPGRRPLEFEEGDHVFLKVSPMTGVGRSVRAKKLSPRYMGPYDVIEKIGDVSYRIALPPQLS